MRSRELTGRKEDVQKGFLLNRANHWTLTPLHHAVQLTDPDYAEMLLRFGAHPFPENESGKTPIDYAKEEENLPIIELYERFSLESAS
ncbi:MAG: hypothetical protein KR126chlam1_00643 [Chlamydiae bacterium]|nr:hypothetical protein [Chlamydiota bacterium]